MHQDGPRQSVHGVRFLLAIVELTYPLLPDYLFVLVPAVKINTCSISFDEGCVG